MGSGAFENMCGDGPVALRTQVKNVVNRYLRHINLAIDTRTLAKRKVDHLSALRDGGHFRQPVFPLPPSFIQMDARPILESIPEYAARFRDFEHADCNDVGYSFDNDYFSSPDAEVLYTILRRVRPSTVIEVGCGHSTKVIRQAVLDGTRGTRLIAIDPSPRIDIALYADEIYPTAVEQLNSKELFGRLGSADVLFIDSSHVLACGSDVVHLYCQILPYLRAGVLIHIHDVFLPYDYPEEWILDNRWDWNEQYLVHAALMFSDMFEVLWAGYFLQRSLDSFNSNFPHINGKNAQSLWLRKMS
jgi:hypothetical protein